jgi:hypothetical protein
MGTFKPITVAREWNVLIGQFWITYPLLEMGVASTRTKVHSLITGERWHQRGPHSIGLRGGMDVLGFLACSPRKANGARPSYWILVAVPDTKQDRIVPPSSAWMSHHRYEVEWTQRGTSRLLANPRSVFASRLGRSHTLASCQLGKGSWWVWVGWVSGTMYSPFHEWSHLTP